MEDNKNWTEGGIRDFLESQGFHRVQEDLWTKNWIQEVGGGRMVVNGREMIQPGIPMDLEMSCRYEGNGWVLGDRDGLDSMFHQIRLSVKMTDKESGEVQGSKQLSITLYPSDRPAIEEEGINKYLSDFVRNYYDFFKN